MFSIHLEVTFARLRYSLGGDRPSQTARLARSPGRPRVRPPTRRGQYSKVGSARAGARASQPPAYPLRAAPAANAKLQ